MKIIVNNHVYEMGDGPYKVILQIAKQKIPFGVYAVEKNGICELKKNKCRNLKELNSVIASYTKNGFKVYVNGRNRNESD